MRPSMDKLKELIELLNLNKIKSIEIIDHSIDTDTKLMQLYNGIRKGKFSNDANAKNFLYSNNSDSNAYYKLKHTLRERLYNTIFFIDVKSSKYGDIYKAKMQTQKISSLIRILLTKGLKKNAIYMAKKGLKTAIAYEFTEEQLFFARTLRSHVSAMLGDQKKFEEYDIIVNKCSDLLRSELKIEGLFLNIIVLYVNDKSTKAFVYDKASAYLKELEAYEPQDPSANWIYHSTMIQVAKYMSINDYEKTLAVCDKALDKINTLSFKHTKSIINISSQSIACSIQLKLYEKGEKYITLGLSIIQPGVFNWFKYKELYLTLCFHTKQYAKAWEIFNEAIVHKKFKTLQASTREVWKIYEAWLHFFIQAKKINVSDIDEEKIFRISRYANEVPTFFKDKSGLNVPILISQIALLLQQKKEGVILDRMDAIAKYKDRYLDKEYNYRSNVFIRMLLTIPKAYFRRQLVIEQTKKYRVLLNEVPLDLANQSADIEILPYEDIWEILLDQLK